MSERVGTCVCGQTFPIPIKRGRPPVRCDACREAYSNGTLRDRLVSLGIDPNLAQPKRFNSSPTSTPQGEIKEAESEDEIQKPGRVLSVSQRVDWLEMRLKASGSHISQHRDKW